MVRERKKERKTISPNLGKVQQFQQSARADKDASNWKIRCSKHTVVRKDRSLSRPVLNEN